jgi:tetratricopeptide (TPR) repeat protein
VSARTRIWLIVAALAVAAVAVTLGVVALTRDEPAGEAVKPPPLYLDLGVRNDEQAKTLRRAARLYAGGQLPEAARLFARYQSPEARVGAAFASWPRTLDRLRALPTGLAVVRLNRGIVHAALGDEDEARAELRAAARVQPDTPYAVKAGDVLHPRFAPGLPAFVPSTPFPKRLDRLASPEQFAIIEREGKAQDATVDAVLRYGVALQRLGRPVSARREFDRAAGERRDAETLTAAAFRQGSSRVGVRAARPAHAPLSGRADRPLPPRARAALDRRRGGCQETASAGIRRRPDNPPGQGSEALSRPSLRHGSVLAPDEPNGLWRPVEIAGTLSPPKSDVDSVRRGHKVR